MRRWIPTCLLLGLVVFAVRATGEPAEIDPGPIAMSLEEIEDELQRRQDDLERYGQRLTALEAQNAEVMGELEAREAVLRRQEDQVRARLVTLCRLSRGGYLQLLGGASSWADLFRRAQFARSLMDQELDALNAHQSEVEDIARRHGELDGRLDAQRQLQERITQYQDELEAERERRLLERSRGGRTPYRPGLSAQESLDFDASWGI